MNKKYILKNDEDQQVYCIIDGDKPVDDEFERVFGIEKGYGLSAELFGDKVLVKNYFRGDTMASFAVLAVEDTTADTVYQILPLEANG
ncbi:MAG: hypothetical protein IJB26_01685 [Clostridia bacterium]|nr:hypothetical protein [Clostridia bacterium]